MRKVTWTTVGLVALSMLLCGSGDAGRATGGTDASPVELRRTVLQLQADMGRMSQELAQVRAELAEVRTAVGVGGSGRTGEPGGPQGTAARGNTADRDTGDRSTVGTGSLPTQGPRDPGAAVVNAIYTGTVRSVSAGQVVLLDDEGQSFTVDLGERTRVLREGKRITARQLEKGTRVRATVDLLAGHTQAMEIVTLPSAR